MMWVSHPHALMQSDFQIGYSNLWWKDIPVAICWGGMPWMNFSQFGVFPGLWCVSCAHLDHWFFWLSDSQGWCSGCKWIFFEAGCFSFQGNCLLVIVHKIGFNFPCIVVIDSFEDVCYHWPAPQKNVTFSVLCMRRIGSCRSMFSQLDAILAYILHFLQFIENITLFTSLIWE